MKEMDNFPGVKYQIDGVICVPDLTNVVANALAFQSRPLKMKIDFMHFDWSRRQITANH